tara:strand:+ start:109 stop:1227 length:1119 start_codon:yes stop_codon:yes gene_type:complete
MSRKRAVTAAPDADVGSPPTPTPQPPCGDCVVINVGGTRFVTSINTLSASSTYFSTRFSRWSSDQELFLDRDAAPFAVLLTFMRSELIDLPSEDVMLWHRTVREAEFFGIDSFLQKIKAQTYRNDQAPSWTGTDDEAAAAFDEHHVSLDEALKSGLLPSRFHTRKAGFTEPRSRTQKEGEWHPLLWQGNNPRVLQLLPADGHKVVFELDNTCTCGLCKLDLVSRDVLSLALVQHADMPGPTLDAFVTNDRNGGGILASCAYGHGKCKRWRLIKKPKIQIIQLPEGQELVPLYWNDSEDHSKGSFRGDPVKLLRVTADPNPEHIDDPCDARGAMIEPVAPRYLYEEQDDRGKLVLKNVMTHNNFKGFEGKRCL